MNDPLVTVLLPTYKRPEWLEESLVSILNQDYPVHIVILDNGSNCERTTSVINGYIERFYDHNYIRTCHNSFDNITLMNKYILGKYVIRFTDDDIMLPGNIRQKVEVLESDPDIGICFSPARCIDDNGNPTGDFKGAWKSNEITFEDLLPSSVMVMPSTVIRSDAFRSKYNGISIGDEWAQDLQILHNGYTARYIDKPMVDLRIHEGSDTNSRGFMQNMFIDMHMDVWTYWLKTMKVSIKRETWDSIFNLYANLVAKKYNCNYSGPMIDELQKLVNLMAECGRPIG